jgi:hypothetical protein
VNGKKQPLAPWNWLQPVFREELIFPFITTCAIEATIRFDSTRQVDDEQVFHAELFVSMGKLRCGN